MRMVNIPTYSVWNHLHAIDPKTELELLQTPSDLTVSLLPFQREGVAWMINQVRRVRGSFARHNYYTCKPIFLYMVIPP